MIARWIGAMALAVGFVLLVNGGCGTSKQEDCFDAATALHDACKSGCKALGADERAPCKDRCNASLAQSVTACVKGHR